MPGRSVSVLLLSGTHERVHFAFSLAAGAAALGRGVTLFASGAGATALLDDWSGIEDVGRDVVIRRRGQHGLGEIRQAAQDSGVRMLVCEASLRVSGIEQGLWPGVERSGIAAFLEAAGDGQIVSV